MEKLFLFNFLLLLVLIEKLIQTRSTIYSAIWYCAIYMDGGFGHLDLCSCC
ncbi:hypothetical protein AAZX31_19G065700 [Glycine max]